MDLNNIENSLEGYKYLVSLIIIVDGKDQSPDNICICDTRDDAMNEINHQLEENIKAAQKFGTVALPYTINKFGTLVKWRDINNNTWQWEFTICPIKYIAK